MYFEITTKPTSVLPFSIQLYQRVWLHLSSQSLFYGYQLGTHGGNFLKIDLLDTPQIKFGFYKDFYLTQNLSQGVLLSNIDHSGTRLPSTIVAATCFCDQQIEFTHYNLKKILFPPNKQDLASVIINVADILLDNLKTLSKNFGKLFIAYSGGLDSSTLAWLAHRQGILFTAVIDKKYNQIWKQLPFDVINSELILPLVSSKFNWYGQTVEHFYNNNYSIIGGFYGDTTVLHHSSLYQQACGLDGRAYNNNGYDRTNTKTLPIFGTELELRQNIIQLQTTPQFRHWYEHCLILDAYRDPRLVEAVTQLSIGQLLDQLDSANIQKQILQQLDALDFVCDYKNDYSKFQIY